MGRMMHVVKYSVLCGICIIFAFALETSFLKYVMVFVGLFSGILLLAALVMPEKPTDY